MVAGGARGTVLFGTILALLWIPQEAELYNGWDILFARFLLLRTKYSVQLERPKHR